MYEEWKDWLLKVDEVRTDIIACKIPQKTD